MEKQQDVFFCSSLISSYNSTNRYTGTRDTGVVYNRSRRFLQVLVLPVLHVIVPQWSRWLLAQPWRSQMYKNKCLKHKVPPTNNLTRTLNKFNPSLQWHCWVHQGPFEAATQNTKDKTKIKTKTGPVATPTATQVLSIQPVNFGQHWQDKDLEEPPPSITFFSGVRKKST